MLQILEADLAMAMSGRHGCVLCDVFFGREKEMIEREEGEQSLINLGTNFLNLEI